MNHEKLLFFKNVFSIPIKLFTQKGETRDRYQKKIECQAAIFSKTANFKTKCERIMDPTQSPGFGRLLLVIAGILLLIYAGFALAIANENSPPPPTKSEHSLLKTAMSGGGRPSGQGPFTGNGTLGQPLPVGSASTSDYGIQAGFWAGARLPFSGVPEASISTLGQNFPNPFNPATSIPFFLAEDTRVDLAVYDARGRRIRTLAQDFMPKGDHRVIWDGKDALGQQAASGVYLFRLHAGKTKVVKKMILVK